MKTIEATIAASQVDEVKDRLMEIAPQGMTLAEVRRFGRLDGRRDPNRGSAHDLDSVPALHVELVIEDEMVRPIVAAIVTAARREGDDEGQVLVSTVSEVIHIRGGSRPRLVPHR